MEQQSGRDSPVSSTYRLSGVLPNMFIGDALAMVVHWYCNPRALIKNYGKPQHAPTSASRKTANLRHAWESAGNSMGTALRS